MDTAVAPSVQARAIRSRSNGRDGRHSTEGRKRRSPCDELGVARLRSSVSISVVHAVYEPFVAAYRPILSAKDATTRLGVQLQPTP